MPSPLGLEDRASGPEGGSAALLETYANNSSPEGVENGRARRYRRRSEVLWPLSDLERVRKCGRVRQADSVGLRYDGKRAGLSGLCTCGSIWACPVCSAKVMGRRRLEIGAAIALAQSQGWGIAMHTFTMRHRSGQPLGLLWDALGSAWGRVTSGKHWVAERAALGVVGYLRMIEVTYGANGWHVHIHALLFFERTTMAVEAAALHASMFKRWRSALVKAGLKAPLLRGQEWHVITGSADSALAEYLAKAVDMGLPKGAERTAEPSTSPSAARSIALELTAAQGKLRRTLKGTFPVWQLLDFVQLEADADSLDLWNEYERASKGRRALTWSQGLRELLALGREASDEEIAAENLGCADLLSITAAGWDALVERSSLIPRLLDVTEHGGIEEAEKFLQDNGIEYEKGA